MSNDVERLQAAVSDRYEVIRELGHGGMATVFLARDIKHDRRVAIKVLQPEIALALGAERFQREIRIAARLQHPQILDLYDSGSSDGLHYYVMPYVEGKSLRERLDQDGILRADPVRQAWLRLLSGERAGALGIWSVLMFQAWRERWS